MTEKTQLNLGGFNYSFAKVCKKSANRAFTVTKNGNTTLLIAPGTYTTYKFQKIK